jgi:hypothetical protein
MYLRAGATALSILSKHGNTTSLLYLALLTDSIVEFRPPISTVIPDIVNLITHEDRDVHIACADALSNLSAHGKTTSLLGLLSFLTIIAEFWPLIEPAIPAIINMYKEGYYLPDFSKLWEQGMTSIYQV